MDKEFYLNLKINNVNLNALELEKIIHAAIKLELGRDLNFPEEDIVITPIEFYSKEDMKKIL